VCLDGGYGNDLTMCIINGKYNPSDESMKLPIKVSHHLQP
jgi:hypothetical protein